MLTLRWQKFRGDDEASPQHALSRQGLKNIVELRMTSFNIYHGDALEWLAEQKSFDGCSIITSLPDISEFSKFIEN